MTAKKKGSKKGETTWTLTQTAVAYLESLRAAKKSESTVSAYAADLDLATEVLGSETPIAQLTLDDITRFNASEPVLRTKSGRDKAMPTIERSRRVLRLALVFAEQQGAIEAAPIPAKKRATKDDETPAPATPEPVTKPKGRRAKKSADAVTEPATEPTFGSEEWRKAQRDLPLHQREAIGHDDQRDKPAAADDDPAQIVYASTGEPVSS